MWNWLEKGRELAEAIPDGTDSPCLSAKCAAL